jgi:hypothetical protein
MAKVTKETVKLFATGIKDFMTYLGLGDWDITLKQEDLSELGSGAVAAVGCDIENCLATFDIEQNWPDTEPQERDNVRRIALHEVLHVLFHRYDDLARDRHVTAKQLLDAEHDVIRRLIMLYSETKRKNQ